jgi:hypothetical protein
VDRDEIVRVLRAFEAAGLEYVLIGATAMGFHGLVRATEDIDLVIKATPENVERLRVALRAAYDNDPHIEEISETDLLGDYPAVRYYPPSGDLYFDVLTRLGEMARFETIESEIKELEGTRVPIATAEVLSRLDKNAAAAERRQTSADTRVQRFRSIQEMSAAPVRATPPDMERFFRHCARWWKAAPRVYPRGVFRFRSIEEAQRARADHGRTNA